MKMKFTASTVTGSEIQNNDNIVWHNQETDHDTNG